jgi:hypothetical protein
VGYPWPLGDPHGTGASLRERGPRKPRDPLLLGPDGRPGHDPARRQPRDPAREEGAHGPRGGPRADGGDVPPRPGDAAPRAPPRHVPQQGGPDVEGRHRPDVGEQPLTPRRLPRVGRRGQRRVPQQAEAPFGPPGAALRLHPHRCRLGHGGRHPRLLPRGAARRGRRADHRRGAGTLLPFLPRVPPQAPDGGAEQEALPGAGAGPQPEITAGGALGHGRDAPGGPRRRGARHRGAPVRLRADGAHLREGPAHGASARGAVEEELPLSRALPRGHRLGPAGRRRTPRPRAHRQGLSHVRLQPRGGTAGST